MDKLNFIGSLDNEQAENAIKVARMAREAGVDPTLAVAIAFKESSLRTNAARGKSGEIGMMQVMPSTGASLGYDEEKLANPNQNIKAGIKYLKEALQATENDPKLAAIYYNGGPGAIEALKYGREPDPRVFDYIRLLNSYGTFGEQQPPEQRKPEQNSAGQETDYQIKQRDLEKQNEQEIRLAQILGGAAGVGASVARAAGSGAGAALESAAQRVGQGFRTGMQGTAPRGAPSVSGGLPVTPSAPGIPAAPAQGGLPATRQAGPAGGPLSNAQQTARILQGTLGDEGTTGRARATGFNTQTAQDAAAQKEMQRLTQRLQQSGVLAEDAAALFARQPGMTATPSGVLYPRTESPATLGPRGPQGQIGFTVPPAPATPAPPSFASRVVSGIAERATSGLDQVNRLFDSMMRPIASTASAAVRYVAPPLAAASAAGEGVNIAQQFRKPADDRDMLSAALSAANILGSGMSMFPPTARIGVPLALGTGVWQAFRDNQLNPEFRDYLKKKLKEDSTLPQSSSRELYAP